MRASENVQYFHPANQGSLVNEKSSSYNRITISKNLPRELFAVAACVYEPPFESAKVRGRKSQHTQSQNLAVAHTCFSGRVQWM
jgi:hypothetical protein